MFVKSESIIIILVAILVLFYFFEKKETFVTSSEFRLKIAGTTNTYLYNGSYSGFTTSTSSMAKYILGVDNCLICKIGYTTDIYNNKCLYYKSYNPNNYLIDKSALNYSSTKSCALSNPLALYFDGSTIYYNLNNVKYYLSTDKSGIYYKFSSDISKSLKLEKA